MRNLVFIFGDQLSHQLTALLDFDRDRDAVAMSEVDQEATKHWCHKSRLVFFFAAMRHFRDELRSDGFPVHYQTLAPRPSRREAKTLCEYLHRLVNKYRPERVVITQPGEWQIRQSIESLCREHSMALEIRNDDHFYVSVEDFRGWASGKKSLVLEHFYRWVRKKYHILIEEDGSPTGGDWNYDSQNRRSFGKAGPTEIPPLKGFPPDELTREVIALVESRFADHPGHLTHFDYPVTAAEARLALADFIKHRLANFGDFQDAMWTNTTFLNHARLSAVLNAHLLRPDEVVSAAIEAYEKKHAPLNAVEGFVRQVIGWREFVRGIYWTQMPEYAKRNGLGCTDRDVPTAFWDGQSEMNCVRQAMQSVLEHGYAHHIQRLMVLGLYAQLLGVHPMKFHQWHMAMYIDAIDWVSLPNALGMSQHGDGGTVGTKPYCASGNYINRMSNYCQSCRYQPQAATGENACPMTTMYWHFLDRHRESFQSNRRMTFQLKNLEKKSAGELQLIREQANAILSTT